MNEHRTPRQQILEPLTRPRMRAGCRRRTAQRCLRLRVAGSLILLASWLHRPREESRPGPCHSHVLAIVFFALRSSCGYGCSSLYAGGSGSTISSLPGRYGFWQVDGSQAWLQILIIPLTWAFSAIVFGAVHLSRRDPPTLSQPTLPRVH